MAVSLSEGSLIVDANIWPPPSISCAFVKDRSQGQEQGLPFCRGCFQQCYAVRQMSYGLLEIAFKRAGQIEELVLTPGHYPDMGQ